jgi:hypothetical protein
MQKAVASIMAGLLHQAADDLPGLCPRDSFSPLAGKRRGGYPIVLALIRTKTSEWPITDFINAHGKKKGARLIT